MKKRIESNRCTKLWLFLVLTMAVTAVLSGCATLDQIVQRPTVDFNRMHLTDAGLLQSTAVFNFNVNNPNPIGIRARRITYDLKLNGRNFVAGRLNRGISLAAGGTSSMEIPITMEYLEFFDSVAQLWQTKGADYALTGGFDVGPFTIPFRAHGRFNLPKMPRFSLQNIQIDKLSFSGATLNCRLKMDNPNAFNLLFKRLDYNLNLGGTSFARASARPQGPVVKNGSSVMNLGLNVSFAQLGMSAYKMLQGSNTHYKLDGNMIFDSTSGRERSVPINLAGRVPFSR